MANAFSMFIAARFLFKYYLEDIVWRIISISLTVALCVGCYFTDDWITLAVLGGFEGLLPLLMFGCKSMKVKKQGKRYESIDQSTCKAVLDGLGCKYGPELTVVDTAKQLWQCRENGSFSFFILFYYHLFIYIYIF